MNQKKIMRYRRKREGRTNYNKRLLLLKSKKLRLIIRRSNRQIILQLAEYAPSGDRIICGVSSFSLKKQGWNYACNNLPACYLAGLLLGKRALAQKAHEAIVDAGLQTTISGSRIYAALKGALDAGMKIPASEEIFPSNERLSGEHIAKFFTLNRSQVQFAEYKKKGLAAEKLKQDFEACKKKIMSG